LQYKRFLLLAKSLFFQISIQSARQAYECNMTDSFVLRPLATGAENSEGAFRVHLTASDLSKLGLKRGDLCRLRSPNGVTGLGIAWPSSDRDTNNRVVKIPTSLKDKYGFQFKETLSIEPGGSRITSSRVVIRDITENAKPMSTAELEEIRIPCNYALCK
jgi:hypothetical protein